MPFGLRTASQTFQRYMDGLFRDIPYVSTYIDEICIHHEQYLTHLNNFFKCLSEINFLGCRISKDGILPQPERIQTIKDYDYASLRRFLGMSNYYRRFVPNVVLPLQNSITQTNQKDKVLNWNSETKDSFEAIKTALQGAVHFAHLCGGTPAYSLVTDASSAAIGAVLHQFVGDTQVPIAFFSKKLS